MKTRTRKILITAALAVFAVLITAVSCRLNARAGDIYLYGELHSDARYLELETLAWSRLYHEEGMRDLFIEMPYYSAELMNLWMAGEDEDILEQTLLVDGDGAQGGTQLMVDFYRKLREDCPETVFHGTDVGHQFDTTGVRYLEYLESLGKEDSEEYSRAEKCIEQGETFYRILYEDQPEAFAYRENMMTENFSEEYRRLGQRTVMGIYGDLHTVVGGRTYMFPDQPNMASQLAEKYPRANILPPKVNLARVLAEPDKSKRKRVALEGMEYEAWYGGKAELLYNSKFTSMEVWVLEGAYEDAKDIFTTGITLFCGEYPLPVEPSQVFQVTLTMREGGGTPTWFFRSDGRLTLSLPATEQLKAEQP